MKYVVDIHLIIDIKFVIDMKLVMDKYFINVLNCVFVAYGYR